MRETPATPHRGRRIRVSALLRSAGAVDATFWASATTRPGSNDSWCGLAGHREHVAGDAEWTRHEIVLDVPERADVLAYGMDLRGAGSLWIDGVTMGLAPSGTPTTPADPADGRADHFYR